MALNDPEILARFPDGVLIHPFYQEKLAEQAWGRIARECGLDPRPDARAAATQALAQRRLLLVLDGAETADDLRTAVQVRGLHCGLLITSQNRGHTWHKRINVNPLPDDETRQLLELWTDLQLEDETAAALQKSLGNLPLALRLVGSYLDATRMSAADYLQMPEPEQLRSLDARQEQFPERSVLTVLARTLSRVTPAAKEACALVGVLALAPFEGQEVVAVLGEGTRSALGQLVQFGLLGREDGDYSVSHALVYRYAHQFLKVSSGALVRLAEYYTQLAEQESKRGLAGYQELDRVRLHLLACLKACTQAEAWRESVALVWAMDDYLDLRGYGRVRQAALIQGIDAARQLGLLYYEGAFLIHLGLAYWSIGQIAKAITYYEQALVVNRARKDREGEGKILGNLGNAYTDLGEMETAVSHHQQALVIAREIGNKRMESIILGNLGLAHADLGETKSAVSHYQQALAIAREIGDKRIESNQLGNLGNAYAAFGETKTAVGAYKQALAIAREIGDKQREGSWLGNLGNAYADLGEIETAVSHYQQALAIAREIGDKRGEDSHLGNLGNAYKDLGEMEKANNHYEQALVIAEAIGDRSGASNHAWNLGLLLEEEVPAQAIALMSRLVAYEEEIDHPKAAVHAEYVAAIRRRLAP
jgi:tetratricopeptide (TPR) repeat protein